MGEPSSFSGTLRKRRMEAIRIKRNTEKDKGISQMFQIKKDEDFYNWLHYIGVHQKEAEKAYEMCKTYSSEAFEFYFNKGDSVETTQTEQDWMDAGSELTVSPPELSTEVFNTLTSSFSSTSSVLSTPCCKSAIRDESISKPLTRYFLAKATARGKPT